MVRFIADPIETIRQVLEIMSDPNYQPITGPISIVPSLERAKNIRVNRGTEPIDGRLPTFRAGSGGSRGTRGDLQTQIQKSLDMMDDVQAEAEYMNLSDLAEETQDQELENALASIGRRRPTQFAPSGRQVIRSSGQFRRDMILPRTSLPPKKKRKVSKYQKEFGKQLKLLKKKHPRTPITKLMKRAHAATRKALGMKGTRKGQVRKTARRAFEK